jgi:hypothetical protein
MMLRWFLSAEVREAAAMMKHVRRMLGAQRDLLAPAARENVQRALDGLAAALRSENRVAGVWPDTSRALPKHSSAPRKKRLSAEFR